MACPHFLSLDKGDIMNVMPYYVFKDENVEYSKKWLRPIYFIAWNLYCDPDPRNGPRGWITVDTFNKIEDYIIGEDGRPLCECGCPGC